MTFGRRWETLATVYEMLPEAQRLRDGLSDEECLAWMRLGLVADCWRNPAEEFHDHVPDAEMARITIATFKATSSFVTVEEIDWPGVRSVLLSGKRTVLDGQTVASVFASDWTRLRGVLHQKILGMRLVWEEEPQLRIALTMGLVVSGQMFGDRWFGSPAWPNIVENYVRLLGADDEFRDVMLTAPETFSTDTWRQLVALTSAGRGVRHQPDATT